MRLRIRPLAVPRGARHRWPDPDGSRVLRHRREVGSDVRTIKPGQFVVGSFATSDNTCAHCRYGYQSSCVHREFLSGAQAPFFRVPLADGTLIATAEVPPDELVPSLLTASDVLGTGWFAADAANVKPGATVAVVGDGAVGLLGVLSAKQMGAERIIAMSRHEARQKLAREFGATDIVTERGDDGRGPHPGSHEGRGRGFRARVRRHAGVDDPGDRSDASGRFHWLRRGPARRDARWRGSLLSTRPPSRRSRACASLPA